MTTVGEQFDVQLGKMLDAARNTGERKPYLGNRAVQWGRIDVSAAGVVPMTRTDLHRYRLRRGDLLVCEGGEVGRAAIWQDQLDECYFQKALHRLRPRGGKESYDVRLMLAFLEHWAAIGVFANYVTQTSIAHLPRDKFVDMPLPLPSPSEQRCLGDLLDDLNGHIAALQRLIAKKEAIKQGLLQKLLAGKGSLSGWHRSRLSDLIDGLEAGVSVRSSGQASRGIAVLKTSAISNGRFDPTESKPVIPQDVGRVRCNPVAESLIISRMNTPNLVGEVGYVESDYANLYLPDRLWLARPKRGKDRQANMRWLAYYLSSEFGSREVRGLATGTSGSMKNIPKDKLLALEVPTPPPHEQDKIADAVHAVDCAIDLLRDRLVKARNVKQGVMQQLLTGRVHLRAKEIAT
ncbi:restriction endonuclease subunit S [Streptomyces violascens]|nr:restriction endonuclease subunit S [Streptomyces violascens]